MNPFPGCVNPKRDFSLLKYPICRLFLPSTDLAYYLPKETRVSEKAKPSATMGHRATEPMGSVGLPETKRSEIAGFPETKFQFFLYRGTRVLESDHG